MFWIEAGLVGMGLGAGGWIGWAVGLRQTRHLSLARDSASSADVELDEFLVLRDGEWVPLDPPQFASPGQNPTFAARQKFLADGHRYKTRRVNRSAQ